jgi:aminoglycoside phosphotransferase (APT) family kinase protein
VDELIDRLRNAIPESPAPAIVHGDYRLGNIMLDFNDPRRTVAVLDWEMATLGDPLADLGYTLIYWGNDGDSRDEVELRPQKKLTMQPGFLTREELIGEYAGATGSDVSKIDFYQVLAIYKLAVITEGIYARFLKGQTVGEGFGNYDRTAERLMDWALKLADQSSDPKLCRA